MYQITTSNSSLLITCPGAISVAEAAAKKVGLPLERIIVFDDRKKGAVQGSKYATIGKLVEEGLSRPQVFVEKRLKKGEGMKKTAYLCFSSGTTGKPKVIALIVIFEDL